MRQIEEGIFYDDSYPGVTVGALVYSGKIMMIDAPLRPEDSSSWRSLLSNHRGWNNRFLVSLDAHPDRTLGVRAMESTVLAHQETSRIFKSRSTIFKGQDDGSGAEWESYNEAIGIRWAIPDITFDQRLILHWEDTQIILEHHPGCTPESIWVILPESKVVFVGDTVVLKQPPLLANAVLDSWIEDLDLLLSAYKDFSIISGRGGPAKNEEIHEMRKFLRNVVRRLDLLASKKGKPSETEKMVQPLLSKFSFPGSKQKKYAQRLKNGLLQCYIKRTMQPVVVEESTLENEEY